MTDENYLNHKPLHIVKPPSDEEKEKHALRILQAGTDAFLSQDPEVRSKGRKQVEQILNPAKPLLKLIHAKPRL